MEKLDEKEIQKFYEEVDCVWPLNDKWHKYNQKEIKKFIHRFSFENCKILNAGSGGNDYGLNNNMYHIDIAENKIKNQKHYFVGSIEQMPFKDSSFDVVICVGSVINYCDAIIALNEISRVLKKNGILILEFENSYSFEYRGTQAFKANTSIVTTQYFSCSHKMWVYSLKYIINILRKNNFTIKTVYPFHILSSLAYYFNKSENAAAKYIVLDIFCRYIPILRRYSGNVILLGSKK